MQDININQNAEEYNRLRNLLYSLPIGIFLVENSSDKIIDVNPATVCMIDLPTERILGENIKKFLKFEDKCHEDFDDFRSNMCSECVLESATGKNYFLIANEVDFSTENDYYTLYTIVDVTDRRIAEEKLQESRELYKTLFSSSADGFFILSNTIIKCNDKFCKQLMCKQEDLLFQSLLNFSPEIQPNTLNSKFLLQEKIDRAFKGESQFFYWQFIKKNGDFLDTEISLKAVNLEKSPLLMGNVRDISERLLLEKHKIEKEKLEGVLQLAGAIGHELNQPLQIISAYLELISSNRYSDKVSDLAIEDYYIIPKSKFNIINQSTERMISTIRKLMNITSFETKKYVQESKIIDLDKSSQRLQ